MDYSCKCSNTENQCVDWAERVILIITNSTDVKRDFRIRSMARVSRYSIGFYSCEFDFFGSCFRYRSLSREYALHLCFVVTTMIHYIFFQYVHTSMHIPRGRWIERTKWFKKKWQSTSSITAWTKTSSIQLISASSVAGLTDSSGHTFGGSRFILILFLDFVIFEDVF